MHGLKRKAWKRQGETAIMIVVCVYSTDKDELRCLTYGETNARVEHIVLSALMHFIPSRHTPTYGYATVEV